MSSTKTRVAVAAVAVLALAGLAVAVGAQPDPWRGATADSGALMDDRYMYLANVENLESFVERGEHDSMPWAVLATDPNSRTLFIAYIASVGSGSSCGSHLGVEVTESDDAVVIAAVSSRATNDSCGSDQTIEGGYFELSRPVGERPILHAATSAYWDELEPDLDTYVPEPEPEITPTAAPYSGEADCTSLLDADTREQLRQLDLTDVSATFTDSVIGQPYLDVYAFLDHGGIVCAWGEEMVRYAFAYGPIESAAVDATRDYLHSNGGVDADMAGVGVIAMPEDGSTYAFGTGYWAVSIDLGAGQFVPAVVAPTVDGGALAQIVANAPVF